MITKRIVRFPSLQGPGSFPSIGSAKLWAQVLSAVEFNPVKMDWLLSVLTRHYIGLCKPCDFSCRSSCRFGYEFLRWQFHDDEAPSFQDTETASAS